MNGFGCTFDHDEENDVQCRWTFEMKVFDDCYYEEYHDCGWNCYGDGNEELSSLTMLKTSSKS